MGESCRVCAIPIFVACLSILTVESSTYHLALQWDQISTIQQTDPFIYQGYTGAFASFFETGDPNAHKLTNASTAGVPLLQKSDAEEFFVAEDGFSDVPIPLLSRRCAFWRSVAAEIPI